MELIPKLKTHILKTEIEIEYTVLLIVCNWNHDFLGGKKNKRSKGLEARANQRLTTS